VKGFGGGLDEADGERVRLVGDPGREDGGLDERDPPTPGQRGGKFPMSLNVSRLLRLEKTYAMCTVEVQSNPPDSLLGM
jgi:hypothetical protein